MLTLAVLLGVLAPACAPLPDVREGIVVDRYPALVVSHRRPWVERVHVIVVWDDRRDVRGEWRVDLDVYRGVVMGQRISRRMARE